MIVRWEMNIFGGQVRKLGGKVRKLAIFPPEVHLNNITLSLKNLSLVGKLNVGYLRLLAYHIDC